MTRKPASLALALVALAFAGAGTGTARAQGHQPPRGYERVEGKGFVVERMPFDRVRGEAALALLEQARAAVEERLGQSLGWPDPVVILAPTDDEFVQRFVAIDGGRPVGDEAAVAWAALSTILVRGPRVDTSQLGLVFVLRHELSHVVMGRVIGGRGAGPLPRWLDEGLAEYAAGAELSREDELELAAQARAGRLEDLAALETHFPHHLAGDRAYRESLDFVHWLDRNAQHGVKGVVRALAEGERPPAAIRLTTGMDLHEAELAWHLDLAERRSVVESLARSSGFWWGLVSLLAIVACARQIYVARRLKSRMED